jgi:uncharacterized protein YhbP (UPF0306 family)
MNTEIKEAILDFLKADQQKLGVISTIHADNTPESAIVYYTFDQDLNLYIATRTKTRKYKNILENHHVAFVIAKETPPQTIQIEGEAEVVHEPGEQKHLFEEIIKLASSRNFSAPIAQMESSELKFVKISPTWIRFGNFEARRHGEMFQEIKNEQ